MSNKLVIGVISLVFAVIIIMLFVPALKVENAAYDGIKTDTMIADNQASVPAEKPAPVSAPAEKPTPAPAPVKESAPASVSQSGLYSVVDGNKLDETSYEGFKLYRNWCARCHGTYGQGMIGPNLATSLKAISKEEFFATIENGKAGSIGSMPAWKANPKVMAGRGKLYAYLMARSDGAIGEIKPSKQ